MIYSTRHLQDMRAAFLSITAHQWILLAAGLIVGGTLWVLFNRRILGRVLGRLRQQPLPANAIAAVEGLMGGTVFLVNAVLVYLSTILASVFLFAFAVGGLLVGAWITIPASFE
jgi:hypothetical protein